MGFMKEKGLFLVRNSGSPIALWLLRKPHLGGFLEHLTAHWVIKQIPGSFSFLPSLFLLYPPFYTTANLKLVQLLKGYISPKGLLSSSDIASLDTLFLQPLSFLDLREAGSTL